MLEPIGLGDAEEATYDALVRRTRATVPELAQDTRSSLPVTRRAVRTLVELGLATQSAGRPSRYVVVPPDRAIEAVLREREAALRDTRRHIGTLMEMYRASTRFAHPGELVEVITGRDEVNERWGRMQQDIRVQMRGFDRPPYAAPRGASDSNEVELGLLGRGVKCRVVYDKSALELPGRIDDIELGMRHGEQARIDGDVPMKLAIADDRLAIIPLMRPGDPALTASYLIHPSPLLDALIALFEAVWSRSVPVRFGSTEPGELSADEAKLLMLLASGATDRAAGRALGWSERTVQRHVTKLMTRVGAQTRFQIAMEATRRGWI
ncbi:helix-turn-helix transcriptional regulator [Amycolatopsis solani]|uniref:helix-turn-helix transcriptional regulator n=1 Tax=Amycolatopsis solani TaxID=3028615 RepID=UPI0025B1B687|nr:LuxR family transcriptional regulator [Amycolatopsis sp. MEP2-6]